MTLANSSPVAGTDVEATPIRANLEGLDVRLASVETQIADLAVSMDTYANGVFYGGLVASIVGTNLIYSAGGMVCSHTYYYKSILTEAFAGLGAATYYVEMTSAGDVDIYPSTSADRTNLNTVVWNGSGFDSVTTANRVILYGDDQFVALPGRSGGQIIYGGIGTGENLTLESTTHATKGYVQIGIGVAGVDYAIKFKGETNDGILIWMEDEDYFQFADGILIPADEQIYYRDNAIYTASLDDGHYDITADVSVDLNTPSVVMSGKVSSTPNSVNLGASVTTFAITSNVATVTGDAGANTIATITGGIEGQTLILLFVDALVTITDDNSHTANTIDLSGTFVSADDTTLTLIYIGGSWYETSRSVN